MDIRDRLIQICKENHSDYWGEIQPSSWANSADDIIAEFWPMPKDYFDQPRILTDGTVVFEPKRDEDDYCCEFCNSK